MYMEELATQIYGMIVFMFDVGPDGAVSVVTEWIDFPSLEECHLAGPAMVEVFKQVSDSGFSQCLSFMIDTPPEVDAPV
tara:strand:- start:261 stop:497 length:237 start_codon:yes stop_codon:yes gene_type:complete